jgi:polysaccharide export outer membrane protein
MTVRQALSMAGGFDVLRFRMDNPFIEASDLRGAYEGAWIDYAREQSRLDRLRVELGDGPRAAATDAADPPVPKRVLSQLRDVEAATLKVRMDDYDKQRAHLASLVAQYDADIAVLVKTHGTEADGMQYDEAEFKRVDDLYRQGTLPLVRVVEARRVMLLSATQALQSQVEIEQARKEREIARRKQEAFDADRRKDLLAQVQDSQAKLFGLRSRLSAIADKLLYVGALKTQLRRGAAGGGVVLTLHRLGEPARPVGEDAELQPADVVEVSLKADNDGALAADASPAAASPR